MFITKKHLSRRTSFAVQVWPSDCRSSTPWFPRGPCSHRRGAEASYGLHVSAARRDHGALDAGRRRHELRAVADPPAVRAVQKAVDDRQRAREQAGHCAAGPCAQPGHVAQLCHSGAEPGAAWRCDDRSDGGRADRPGHAAAITRVATEGRGGKRRLRSHVRLQLRRHDLVPLADDAAADGIRSAQAVRAALRSG